MTPPTLRRVRDGRALASFGLVLWICGCGLGEPRFGPGVAARIGGRDIAYREFEEYVRRATGEEVGGLESAVLTALFGQFLEQQLLARLAIERGLMSADAPPEAAARRLLESAPPPPVDDAAIVDYYRAHGEEFEVGERVRLRQVLLQDRAVADRVHAELSAGTAFAEVARRHSAAATAVFVAEQDELQRDDLPRAFVEPIFALGAGQTSEVLEAEYGFHVFQVVEKRPAETQSLARVREVVRSRLLADSANQKLQSFVAEAEGRYNVRVAERNLPFPFGNSGARSRPDPAAGEP